METVHLSGDSPIPVELDTIVTLVEDGGLRIGDVNSIGPDCIELCPILKMAPPEAVHLILSACIEDGNTINCSRPRAGQMPGRFICGAPSEAAKSTLMALARTARRVSNEE